MYQISTPPVTSAFAPGETDVIAYDASPCLPTGVTIATVSATAPAGSGVIPSTSIMGNMVLIKIIVSPKAAVGAVSIALLLTGSDGVTVKPRTIVIPIVAGF